MGPPETQPDTAAARIDHSPNPATAASRFLDALADWAEACIQRYRQEPPIVGPKGHDQLTYTVAWAPLIHHRGHDEALRFMAEQRDRVQAAQNDAGHWHHGYWRQQEVHHGTEHFELFLATLWRLAPHDATTIHAFLDMAEHLGNFSPDVPEWFNYDTGLFRSMFFGTEVVEESDATRPNMPDHFRCLNLALIAHAMTGEVKYRDLAAANGRLWAQAILQCEMIPEAIGAQGPIEHLDDTARDAYRRFAGQAGNLTERVNRAENLLCSDAPTALLRLAQVTGEPVFRDAARRLLDELATQLPDPDAGAAADALRCYRRMTGDTRYDEALREAVAGRDPDRVQQITLERAKGAEGGGRPSGVGKRADMPRWYEDGQPAAHHPITLAAGAEVLGDEALMRSALDLARTRFELARRVFADGRRHGCAATTVSAIARGHGRENNAGMATAVLEAYLAPDRLTDGGPVRAA